LLIDIGSLSKGQENKETATAYEFTAEENYKRLGSAETNESPGPLITGVDAMKLFEYLIPGYKEDPNTRSQIRPYGVSYILKKKINEGKKALTTNYILGVLEDREKAIIEFGCEVGYVSGPVNPLSGLGDRAYYSSNPSNNWTTIRFRRKNVIVILEIDLPSEEVINIAKKMDYELEHNTTFITRGDKVITPKFEIKNFPEIIELNKNVECGIELKDIDPNDILIDSDSSAVIIQKGKEPKIIYHAPKIEREAGVKTFRIFIANKKNVIAKREYKINAVSD